MAKARGIRVLSFVAAVVVFSAGCRAANIEGTVVVKRQLTRMRVTETLPLYQRGTVVAVKPDEPGDRLSLERSRVLVYLEGRAKKPVLPVTAVLEQENRRFVQETVVIPVGSSVLFPNRDKIFHNVFSLSKAKAFDLGNYPKGSSRTVVFNEPGVVFVNCHLHPNMVATVVVAPNQWYAKAAGDGHFALHDVPPGSYTLVAWHKATGSVRRRIDVVEGRDMNLEILIPFAEEGASEEKHGASPGMRAAR